METWNERMRRAIEDSPYTPNSLAKEMGVAAPSVSAWIGAAAMPPAKNISGDNLLRACELLKVRPEWVLYRKGAMRPFSQDGENVNSGITGQSNAFSMQSARQERARLLAETLLDLSPEMRELIDQLVDIDYSGGIDKEMVVAGVGFVLKSRPAAQAQKKVK